MTISIGILSYILINHWIADFILQTDWQAKNKSSNDTALLRHTAVYALTWIPLGFEFFLVTHILHSVTDYFTSRLNTKLWKAGKVHWFFVSVGFDQLLHYAQLIGTYLLLNSMR